MYTLYTQIGYVNQNNPIGIHQLFVYNLLLHHYAESN